MVSGLMESAVMIFFTVGELLCPTTVVMGPRLMELAVISCRAASVAQRRSITDAGPWFPPWTPYRWPGTHRFRGLHSPALGPPEDLIAFLCTCKPVYHAASISHARFKFQRSTPTTFTHNIPPYVRYRCSSPPRSGTGTIHSQFLTSQLKTYYVALKKIRREDHSLDRVPYMPWWCGFCGA